MYWLTSNARGETYMRRNYLFEGKFLGIIVPVGIFMEKSAKPQNILVDLLKTVCGKVKLLKNP